MQEIKKVLNLGKQEYFETHLSIINCILPVKMTPKEIEVLATFMSLEGDIASYRFGTSGRKIVMKAMGLSPAGLSNYLNTLKEKSLIKESSGMIIILPLLFPEATHQDYRFRLIKNNHDKATEIQQTREDHRYYSIQIEE